MRKFLNLETLNLAGNQISGLPKSFERLAALKTLDVSRNQLTGFLLPEQLTSLNISQNPIDLPSDDPKGSLLVRIAERSHPRYVTSLNISHLHLTTVPLAVMNLRMLVELNASHNELESLPEDGLIRLKCLKRYKSIYFNVKFPLSLVRCRK